MTDIPLLKRLLKQASEDHRITQPVPIEKLDFSRPFIPEDYTQLYYTPLYASLSDEQRLRYNQLFAVRVNEYVMMLESDLVDRVLTPLCRQRNIRAQPELLQCLEVLIEEERRHYRQFLDLNRHCLPGLFEGGRERYFSELPRAANLILWGVGKTARNLAFPLWYILAMEEASMVLARTMNRRRETETLGALEPQFTAVHLEHMKDEARHLPINQHLIAACLESHPPWLRRLNAGFFKRMIRAMTLVQPYGSGVKVVRHLVRDRPELKPREEELVRAVMDLSNDHRFQYSLFNREIMPVTFAQFDRVAEFEGLGKFMVGYERN